MDNSKLSQHLRMLSPREFRQYASLVRSPFFTRHADTVRLLDILEPLYPEFAITDEDLGRAMDPANPLGPPRLRVLRSYLLDLLEEFLIQLQLQEEKALRTEFLARQLTDRGLYTDAERILDRQRETSASQDNYNLSALSAGLRLEITVLNLHLRRDNRDPGLGLEKVFHSLDAFYIATRLQYLCTFVSQEFHLPVQLPADAIAETLRAAERPMPAAHPIIAVYYRLLKLLLQNDSHALHYPTLAALIRSRGPAIGKDELVNIFGFLQNHLNQRYQSGHPDALAELLHLYGSMLDLDVVFGRGTFSTHLFRNIAVVGARLGEFEWTLDFIHGQAGRLDEDQRDAVKHYCLAYLHFTRGLHGEALHHLLQVDFIDPFYRTGHQILLLRIYYETGETEAFFSLAQTFRRFLNRNRSISDTHREASLNFISMARKLMTARDLEGKSREKVLSKVKEEIADCRFLTDRTWIMAKVEEMGGGMEQAK